jgi:hypothetical protein
MRKARPGEFCVVSTRRGSYAVVGPDGTVLTSGWGDQLQAIIRMEKLEAEAKLVTRPCITCRTDMRSEGPHHRMCDDCRIHAADQYGRIEPATMPRLTVRGR